MQTTADRGRLFTQRDVAECRGVGVKTVRRWRLSGILPPYDEAITQRTSGWYRSTLADAGVHMPADELENA